MSIFECIYYFVLSLLSMTSSNSDASTRLILCFHSISNSPWRFAVTPLLFESQIQELLRHFEIVPLSVVLTSEKKSVKPLLALTFDDGYADNLTTAAPILRKYGLVGTLFVIGSANKANQTELGNDIPLLQLSQLRKLKNDFGWELGYHTDTHADLSCATQSGIEKEIFNGKASFEEKLGYSLTYFAYPRGYTSALVTEVVKKAGFRYGLTVNGRQVNKSNPYATDRINCEGKITPRQLIALMSPIGISVISIMTRCLQIKEYIILPYFKRVAR